MSVADTDDAYGVPIDLTPSVKDRIPEFVAMLEREVGAYTHRERDYACNRSEGSQREFDNEEKAKENAKQGAASNAGHFLAPAYLRVFMNVHACP